MKKRPLLKKNVIQRSKKRTIFVNKAYFLLTSKVNTTI